MPSWLNEKDCRARESVPEPVFRRFHLCKWGNQGDVFTDEMIINAMSREDAHYLIGSDYPTSFGLDFGPKHNWTALSGVQARGRDVYKMYKNLWIPRGETIQVQDVEDHLESNVFEKFPATNYLGIETYQMVSTIQKMIRIHGEDIVKEWTPTEASVVAISKNIFQLFSNYRFYFPSSDGEFESNLRDAELAPASGRNGTQKDDFKILFKDLGEGGHGDDFRATAIAAMNCTQNYSRAAIDILKDIHVVKPTTGGISSGGRKGNDETPFGNAGKGLSPWGRGGFDFN